MSDNDREPQRGRFSWKKAVVVVGGLTVVVAGTVAVTLLATHKSAVTENAIAFVNGIVEGYSKGFADGHSTGVVKGAVDGWAEGFADGLEEATTSGAFY